jgi:hypothetical protein
MALLGLRLVVLRADTSAVEWCRQVGVVVTVLAAVREGGGGTVRGGGAVQSLG